MLSSDNSPVPLVTALLKQIRAAVPINHVLTGIAKRLRPSDWVMMHLPRSGDVAVDLPNGRTLRLWSKGDDGVSTHIYWRGWDAHEPETTGLWWDLCQDASVILDVGAHVGLFSLLAAHANPGAEVHAFEPLPVVLERLRRNIELNDLRNVHVHEVAAGAEHGEASMYYEPGTIPSCQLDDTTSGERRLVVKVVPLDALRLPPVDLVKIDTETTEPDVLRGMRGILERDRPTIVCEVLTRGDPAGLEEVLSPLGYRYFELLPTGPVERSRITPGDYRNYLFRA
jgi:FkbM family methyltransferase